MKTYSIGSRKKQEAGFGSAEDGRRSNLTFSHDPSSVLHSTTILWTEGVELVALEALADRGGEGVRGRGGGGWGGEGRWCGWESMMMEGCKKEVVRTRRRNVVAGGRGSSCWGLWGCGGVGGGGRGDEPSTDGSGVGR